ncbi:hypothetical protein RXV94_12190 [Yeosuana sp. MJ-SS3]|uniref:DUF2607 family protein n=1 Tax=Gilvirhabdus luticola TaxID=3079858 RepID=A0ABU3U937_9FLAO|nr:hypothetical protein [Yeosuana sp. MJ-SS3]MDU8886924.1 hypothetical protein [Yeosuana sp. MJ-SS3]
MQELKQHIVFKILSIALLITILIPSAVKLAHVFQNHKHEVCLEQHKTHLHTLDLECKFYKFKVNNTFTIPVFNIEIAVLKKEHKPILSHYSFISHFQSLHFSLRAPPQLV